MFSGDDPPRHKAVQQSMTSFWKLPIARAFCSADCWPLAACVAVRRNLLFALEEEKANGQVRFVQYCLTSGQQRVLDLKELEERNSHVVLWLRQNYGAPETYSLCVSPDGDFVLFSLDTSDVFALNIDTGSTSEFYVASKGSRRRLHSGTSLVVVEDISYSEAFVQLFTWPYPRPVAIVTLPTPSALMFAADDRRMVYVHGSEVSVVDLEPGICIVSVVRVDDVSKQLTVASWLPFSLVAELSGELAKYERLASFDGSGLVLTDNDLGTSVVMSNALCVCFMSCVIGL